MHRECAQGDSVELNCLDPPVNSHVSRTVQFNAPDGAAGGAQGEASGEGGGT
jgi:hypothetical protein